jgi:hypothetical protein
MTTSDRHLALMNLMREVTTPAKTYDRCVRRAAAASSDSPEYDKAVAFGNSALDDIEQAVRRWVAANPEPAGDEPFVQPTGYVVSCLPEGHTDRWTFTVQVKYAGGDRWAVRHHLRHYSVDGAWEYEPDHGEDDDAETAWKAQHTFDHDTALRIAREVAPSLTYRGYTVADALAEHRTP